MIGTEVSSCGFVRICFECEVDATHTIEAERYNSMRRTDDDSNFISDRACPKHARCYSRVVGVIPALLPAPKPTPAPRIAKRFKKDSR